MAKEEASLIIRIKEIGAKTIKGLTDGLKNLGSAAKSAGQVMVGIGGALVGATLAYKKQEQAVNKLNQAMINSGDYTAEASKSMQDFAAQLQKTSTYGDETIIDMLALAKSFGFANDEAKKMVEAAANLAAGTGMSLESAVKNLGKTMSGLTGELGESLPALRELTAEQLKSGAAIDLVAQKFKGAAEAQAAGTGSIDQAKNAIGDFLETIGKQAAPFINFFAKALSNASTALQENKDLAQGLTTTISGLSKFFIILKNIAFGAVETITTGLGTVGYAISNLLAGRFTQAADVVSTGMDEIGKIAVERFTQTQEELNALDEEIKAQEEAKRQQELLNEQISADNKLLLKQQANKKLLKEQKAAADAEEQIEKDKNEKLKAHRANFLGHIAGLQSSNNKMLVAIGKAAAIAQITINTAEAASSGDKWGMAIGGPPLAAVFRGLAYAAGAAQIAQVQGVKLAEGGIIPATPGGVPAIIGEGGKDEAVIPLDDDGAQSRLGGTTVINFNGPVMGDDQQAEEFARMIDRKLLDLRRSNQSVSFDEDTF